MEYILNKIDENVRKKVASINNPSKTHKIKKSKINKEKFSKSYIVNPMETETYTVEVKDTFIVEAEEITTEKVIGKFIDRKE